MDPNTRPPVQPSQQVAQTVTQPIVPVSDQPLTLDPNQMSEVSSQSQPPAQPVIQPLSRPIQAPQNPVSGPHKEVAPVRQMPTAEAPVAEYVRPTEVAPQLQQEVVDAGVEVVHNPEQPQLTQEHKAVGLELAKEAVPVTIPAQPTTQLPYSAQEVKEIEKKVPISESKHWLAALTEYLLKKLQGAAV